MPDKKRETSCALPKGTLSGTEALKVRRLGGQTTEAVQLEDKGEIVT